MTGPEGAPTNYNGFGRDIRPNLQEKEDYGTIPVDNQAANIAACVTVDGSDPATTQALANALKGKVNEILTALKNAGVMYPDAPPPGP